MSKRHISRRAGPALVLLVAFLLQGTRILAGTTGSLSGQVTDEHGTAVAGATVSASSPSQAASVTTDATGHFTFLSLAPDTYAVTATKTGYTTSSTPGVTVFADQTLTLALHVTKGLKQIAHVTARAAGSLVRAGTTVDVYAVNAATAQQLATSGGGNNLDSAYSAIYSVPGVTALPGNFGFGQVFSIHGSSYNQIGYEFDGVPVNRSFDNYNASSLSNLGAQSIETYTGGGPANATSPTLGGYINEVIKTGTYPGYASLGGGIGAPGYYHQVQVEAGGSTPDRNFSWYVGLRGSDMIPNQIDAQNGGDLNPDGNNQFGQQGFFFNTLLFPAQAFIGTNARGPWSDCTGGGGVAPANGSYLSPVLSGFYGVSKMYACNAYSPLPATATIALRGNDLSDRENVLNFHVGVPHRNDAGRDDIQLLYDNFLYQTQAWDNISTFGGLPFMASMFSPAGTASGLGNYNTFLDSVLGAPAGYPFLPPAQMPAYAGFCAYFNLYDLFGLSPPCASTGQSPAPYFDGYQVVNAHFGQSALGQPNIVSQYYFPSTTTNRPFQSGFSPYQVSDTDNNGSIVKLQYTKNFSSNAFLRVYGYTFYSDWLQTDPNASLVPFLVGGATEADYELNTHTRGLYAQFADQLNAQNLFTLTGSYTTATLTRWNNSQFEFSPAGTPIASLMGPGGRCYAAYNNQQSGGLIDPGYGASVKAGAPVSCLSALAGAPIAAVQAGQGTCPSNPFGCLQAVPSGAPAGTTWSLTQNLEPDGNYSTVAPRFFDAAIQDEFRPTDRWDINAGIRWESYGYVLGDFSSTEQQFWFNQLNQTVCVAPVGLKQAAQTDLDNGAPRYGLVPGDYPGYITTAPGATCPFDPVLNAQLYHPGQNGVPQVTLGGTGTLTDTTYSPRIGFTYTASPDSVIRFSYGRYTQPTPTADEQVETYLDGYQMANNLYTSGYYNIGLASVVHDNPIQFSNNFDASFEQHLKGTDWSVKLSPFYRYTTEQSVEVALTNGLAGAFNLGTLETKGVELAIQKGDPSRNGLSGQLSYTYTDAKLRYALINGSNTIATMLSTLQPFLSLEGINGGYPCYGSPAATQQQAIKLCRADAASATPKYIANPYYGETITRSQIQSDFPLDGFYPTFFNFFPYGLQLGDASTSNPPNVFAGFLSWKHDRLQVTLTGNLWEGTQYGAPTDIAGLDPRSCLDNQAGGGAIPTAGIIPGSQLADYQTCSSAIAIPNPMTGQFDSVGQYRNPWQLNLGAQIGYDLTPRIHASVLLANILNACFGGSAEPWTAAYPPNSVICAYAPNGAYIGSIPGEGYFYGNSPHAAVNGTTGYPKVFDQAYAPTPNQIAAPFQAYFQVNIRM